MNQSIHITGRCKGLTCIMSHFKAHWTLLQMCVQIGKKSLKAKKPSEVTSQSLLHAPTTPFTLSATLTAHPHYIGMAANERTCTYCGSQFARGWCFTKHMRACAANNFVSVQRVAEATEVFEQDPMSVDDGDDVAEHRIAGVQNVTQQPQAHHREHYRLNAKHLETLQFLGPMCAGLPVADEKMKSILKYARSLDSPRVRFLPKTPATAWRRLAKVRCTTLDSQCTRVPFLYIRTKSGCTLQIVNAVFPLSIQWT